ncbi:MAG: hypothetical protein SGI73_15680 [Chloroflexota bacterium]|nr:hypothetical protein [Chloroflexota bacterium]
MRRIALIFIVCVSFAVLPLSAQDATPTPAPAIAPELAAQMDRLETFVGRARTLDELIDVPRAFPSRDAVRAYLAELYGTDLALQDLGRAEVLYKALWMLPRDTDLGATYLALLGSQVAGFYDTNTQIMNVVPTMGEPGELLTFTEQIIYVHEFTHALQDQRFDLDTLMGDETRASVPDQSLALLSLIEGDATAVMNLYATQATAINPGLSVQLVTEGLLAGNLFLPPDIPAILGRELALPYENGLAFVLNVWRDGGWDAVNAAFANPPTTTEQILHPEKYLAGEGAVEVLLDDVAEGLGDGWTSIWAIPLGEFYLREHLRAGGLSLNAAARAAAGWGGDFLRVYARADADGTPRYAWLLRLVWDTPADADEFETAYEAMATARYGSELIEGCWQDAESSLCFGKNRGEQTIEYIELG